MKCKICGIKEATLDGYCDRCAVEVDNVGMGIVRCINCEKTAEVLTRNGSYCHNCAKGQIVKVQFT